MPDSIVVGSGPNGLAAAIELQKAGYSTTVYESREKIGGGARSAELTLKAFVHDVCSAVHPLTRASPFFRDLPLDKFGLKWITPKASLANPFADGSCGIVWNSLEDTAASFDNKADGRNYLSIFSSFVKNYKEIMDDILGPLIRLPKKPFQLLSFGAKAFSSVSSYVKNFRGKDVPAVFGGCAAHSMLSPDKPLTNGFAMVLLGLAHLVGWPIPTGGAQRISDSLGEYFVSLGGKIITGFEVKSLGDLPHAKAVLFDLTPRQILRILGDQHLPNWYLKSLRAFKYGPGVFKLDCALDGPIPWRSEECLKAGTVHVCGELKDIIISENSVWEGKEPERPYVIVAQHSLFDRTRAPDGKHTLWAYCHVPNGSDVDMHASIESQIERFAPGFKSRIISRHTFTARQMEQYNPNYVGGDINGGVQNIWQTISRPILSLNPYKIPLKGVYICSSSTPPGGGVHGMCGYYAAKAALAHEFTNKIEASNDE